MEAHRGGLPIYPSPTPATTPVPGGHQRPLSTDGRVSEGRVVKSGWKERRLQRFVVFRLAFPYQFHKFFLCLGL